MINNKKKNIKSSREKGLKKYWNKKFAYVVTWEKTTP